MSVSERMSAAIAPLEGKYYGTRIEIKHPRGETEIVVWFMGDYQPSERELRGQTVPEWHEEGGASDSHYETKDGYEIALAIVRALNPK